MATKSKVDSYANMAALSMTEAGANTQTTTKFAFPFSIMDKMALIIHRLEYDFTNLGTALGAAADRLYLGIACAATISSPADPTDPLLLDAMRVTRYDFGTAGSAEMIAQPFTKDFTNLPGGGLLVAPNPLYGLIQGSGAAAAGTGTIRLYYTYMELSADDYWQLVESRRIISS